MANSDKDILITPNKSQSALPEISFVGSGNAPITLKVLDDNSCSFEGSSGQLFSVDNNLTTGNIFTVNDIGGIPSIAVNANGRIDLARYHGSVNIGPNQTATDKELGVTGQIHITSKAGSSTQAAIHFSENGTIDGTGDMYICYEGPNTSNDYLSVRTSGGTSVLNITDTAAVGINNTDPKQMFHLTGGHNNTVMRMTLPAASNGAGNGDVNLQLWVSEPGRTWDGAGIGANVVNYYTQYYPSSASDTSNSYFPRLNTSLGQAYIRFLANPGRIEFSTMETNGTTYRETIHMRYGCLGINTQPSGSWRLQVNGDINVQNGVYRLNGNEFTTLPTQDDATRGSYLVSDGSNGAFWAYPGASNTSSTFSGWRYRSLITHGYIAGGYKGSQPWRSVNKTWHHTDTTMYCGEQLDRAGAYCDGTWGDYQAYVHGTVNSFQGNSSHTSSYNGHTGICRNQGDGRFSQHNYGWDDNEPKNVMGYGTTGGWSMNTGRNDAGCASNQIGQAGYITGGGSSETNKLHFPTEIMYTTNGSGYSNDWVAGVGGETRGYFSWSNGGQQYITYSNDSWSNTNAMGGNRGWCKALPTKHGHFYICTSNNVTTPIRKVRDSDGADLGNFNRSRSAGEENMEMGQDWGYKLGDYNGQQNNQTEKWNYSNDSITAMGAATRPKGHYGQSSAACSSFAAAVTVNQPT